MTAKQVKKLLIALIIERDLRHNQRFDAQEKAVAAALSAAKEAVEKAEAAADKRFEAVNEFRGTLSDQARTFATRAELGAALKGLDDKIYELKARADIAGGRQAGLSSGWAILIGAVSLAGAILAMLWRR